MSGNFEMVLIIFNGIVFLMKKTIFLFLNSKTVWSSWPVYFFEICLQIFCFAMLVV